MTDALCYRYPEPRAQRHAHHGSDPHIPHTLGNAMGGDEVDGYDGDDRGLDGKRERM